MKSIFIIAICTFSSLLTLLHAQNPYDLRQEALLDFNAGKSKEAQKKLIQAYDIFYSEANWDMASMCLYERAIDYMNVGDLTNMWLQTKQLQTLMSEHHSAMVAYNYHSVASGYYSYIDSIDLAIIHGKKAIHALEQIEDPHLYNIVPVWSYYNMAFFYDSHFQPPIVDSVRHYLAQAREVTKSSRTYKDSIEALVSIMDLEAWQEYYVGHYDLAEQMMNQVLDMIDTIAKVSPNTIITERGEALAFLAMLYEEQGKWKQALEYQHKVSENNEMRYSLEKRRVLQEVQTQYEVEKQQLEMEKLETSNRLMRWFFVALGLLILVLLLSYLLLVMRKKNIEAQLYETALEADNMRQTISQLEQKTDIEPLSILIEGLIKQLRHGANREYTVTAIQHLQQLNLPEIQVLLNHGNKITTMDKRYILCFAAGMTVEQIADFMSLEPPSVYTVRYRLRKKFPSEYPFPY